MDAVQQALIDYQSNANYDHPTRGSLEQAYIFRVACRILAQAVAGEQRTALGSTLRQDYEVYAGALKAVDAWIAKKEAVAPAATGSGTVPGVGSYSVMLSSNYRGEY